jgi:hypothetical protein
MLSLTSDDMPNFTYATPEEMRGAQEKALNLWVGATSPLWAPFWLSSAVGVGLWAWGQGLRQIQETVGAIPDSLKALGNGVATTDVQGTVQNMVNDGVIAPIQAAAKAIQDVTEAVTPSPEAIAEQIKAAVDDVTPPVVTIQEAVAAPLEEVPAPVVEKVVEKAEAKVEPQVEAAADVVADTGTLLAEPLDLMPKAAVAAAADTAVSVSDGVRPAPRKPTGKKS